MKITIPTTSARLDSLFTADQGQSILRTRQSTNDFTVTIANPVASLHNVYIERFDSVATLTTSLAIEPGASVSYSANTISSISMIADTAATDIIIG